MLFLQLSSCRWWSPSYLRHLWFRLERIWATPALSHLELRDQRWGHLYCRRRHISKNRLRMWWCRTYELNWIADNKCGEIDANKNTDFAEIILRTRPKKSSKPAWVTRRLVSKQGPCIGWYIRKYAATIHVTCSRALNCEAILGTAAETMDWSNATRNTLSNILLWTIIKRVPCKYRSSWGTSLRISVVAVSNVLFSFSLLPWVGSWDNLWDSDISEHRYPVSRSL